MKEKLKKEALKLFRDNLIAKVVKPQVEIFTIRVNHMTKDELEELVERLKQK